MSQDQRWRYNIVGLTFGIFALLIFAQMLRIQFSASAVEIIQQADDFAGQEKIIYPVRGQIFDRWGNILAANKTVYEVGVDLDYVEDPHAIASELSRLLDEDFDQLLALADQEYEEKVAVYNVLADYVPADVVSQLRKHLADQRAAEAEGTHFAGPDLRGLRFFPHLQRSYPEGDLASNVLGFVSQDGQGYFGVEEYYNDLLAGVPQKVWLPNDPNLVDDLPAIPPGTDLILTLDRGMQIAVEDILDQAVEDSGATGGTIVVMHPQNGEILAMASTSRLDLNEYWRYDEVFPDPRTPFNTAVSKTYEPGSVFKILTMAAALDLDVVTPHTPFVDTGKIEIGGIDIRNWNNLAWGPQDMTTCMQHSLNVCLAWVGKQIGTNDFYEYMQRFGIGRATGIDLAGEASGRLKIPGDGDWYPADLGTNTFGQGLSVTTAQMLMAASAMINDGKMVTPHIVHSMVNEDAQYNITIQVAGEPISKWASKKMTEMLAKSLEAEASSALVTGYRVAGKTGTAEVPTEFGYTLSKTNASFIGWGPVSDPQFMVYVWIEEPETSPWGSIVAAPIFAEVVERLVVLMDIPPDDLRASLASQ